MLELFPVHKKRLAFNLCLFVAMLVALYFISPTINPLLLALIALAGCAAIFIMQYMRAAAQHSALLNVLYNELDAERFLRAYEPLLDRKVRSQNLYLMVRLHLSNAYCALGRFDDAMRVLTSVQLRPTKPEKRLLFQFSIDSNLCYCYEQKGDIEAAQRHLTALRKTLAELEAIQQTKPPKQRMVFSIAFNEQCMKFLTEGCADIDVLKEQVEKSNQQLHRVTASLWIARSYLAQHNRREAERALERIVNLAGHLYPGRVAKELLDALPGRAEDE